ncbi:MAG TPA: 4-oxalocrotonate tautomerase family protein [Roseiarcus sp.]|nr:4-oxalocrotonate tautomerase family protein [Roseiarcus sp.]
MLAAAGSVRTNSTAAAAHSLTQPNLKNARVEMPFVNIRIVREAIASDPERKKATIAEKVTSVISEAAGVPKSDVWVVFEEVAARDWYLGPSSVESLRKGAK